MIRKLPLVAGAALVSQACYTYTPVAFSDVRPDMDVRAELTPAEREGLAEVLPGDDRVLDGTVIDNGSDDLLLEVDAVATQRGVRLESLRQRVRVDQSGIVELERKELDRARTAGLTAAVVGGIAAVVVVAIQAGQSSESPGPGGNGPVDAIVPTWRLSVPIGW